MSDVISDPEPKRESPWKWVRSGWTISLVAIVLVIAGIYIEEDWRGAVAWRQAQEEIAAAGESLDPVKFIPPAISDEQNFGLLPIFAVDDNTAVGMERALAKTEPLLPYGKEDKEAKYFPYLADCGTSGSPDLPTIRKRMVDLCRDKFPTLTIPDKATPVEIFELLCPALDELRAADKVRPLWRFDRDYTTQPPFNRSFTGIVSPIKLTKVLAYEENLALATNQPALSAEDLKVGWRVDAGLGQEPYLISGLVSLAVVAIQIGTVTNGLVAHAWTDAQLKEIDDDLGQIDFLAEAQLCLRGEVAGMTIPLIDSIKARRSEVQDIVAGGSYSGAPSTVEEFAQDAVASTILLAIPNGWFDQIKATTARLVLLEVTKEVDPPSRRVFPEREVVVRRDIASVGFFSVIPVLSSEISSPLHAIEQFAYGQVHLDQARIACRLERYHLIHGVYPPSLDDLTPLYGAPLNDIMTGQPMHYHLLPDGTYLLYSVGWDQKDDGGKMDPARNYPSKYDPDWLWPNHAPKPAK